MKIYLSMNKEVIERIIEAFAYIAERAPVHKKNMYNVLKVFYLADKLHMEKFGRFIFDDNYSAMQRGPVPSTAYDLIKAIRTENALPHSLQSPVQVGDDHIVIVKRKANEDLFSLSDLKCINEIIELSREQDLGELSHDHAWESTARNEFIPTQAILSTLDKSEALLNLYENRHL